MISFYGSGNDAHDALDIVIGESESEADKVIEDFCVDGVIKAGRDVHDRRSRGNG